jgi:hypothetical protein
MGMSGHDSGDAKHCGGGGLGAEGDNLPILLILHFLYVDILIGLASETL